MLSVARELAFRSSLFIGANNITNITRTATPTDNPSTYIQEIKAQQTNDVAVFTLQYPFLVAALVFTFLGILSVLPLYLHWWSLGRRFSISPSRSGRRLQRPCWLMPVMEMPI
jgi:hypothetical protein